MIENKYIDQNLKTLSNNTLQPLIKIICPILNINVLLSGNGTLIVNMLKHCDYSFLVKSILGDFKIHHNLGNALSYKQFSIEFLAIAPEVWSMI